MTEDEIFDDFETFIFIDVYQHKWTYRYDAKNATSNGLRITKVQMTNNELQTDII